MLFPSMKALLLRLARGGRRAWEGHVWKLGASPEGSSGNSASPKRRGEIPALPGAASRTRACPRSGPSLTLSWTSWLPDSSDLTLPQAPQPCEPRSSVGQILPSAEREETNPALEPPSLFQTPPGYALHPKTSVPCPHLADLSSLKSVCDSLEEADVKSRALGSHRSGLGSPWPRCCCVTLSE